MEFIWYMIGTLCGACLALLTAHTQLNEVYDDGYDDGYEDGYNERADERSAEQNTSNSKESSAGEDSRMQVIFGDGFAADLHLP